MLFPSVPETAYLNLVRQFLSIWHDRPLNATPV
jgi:hypothetical protein